MSHHPPPFPQQDPRFRPPNPQSPQYYTPGYHDRPSPPRSSALAVIGIGAAAGMMASIAAGLPASMVFGWFVDRTPPLDFLKSQLEPLAGVELPIPLIFYSLVFGAIQGVLTALPRLGIGARLPYILVATLVGTVAGFLLDLFLFEPLSGGRIDLSKPPIEWLRTLTYNLPLALVAAIIIGSATRR